MTRAELLSSAMPLLRRLDAERAHRLAIASLRLGLAGTDRLAADPALRTRAMGLSFDNPIGLAAGFDKDAEVPGPLLRLGFGFVEVGTVTPRAQPGNPRPRVFRLPDERAIINRYGFNNAGLDAMLGRLERLGRPRRGVLGVNIGLNKQDALPERDYPELARRVAPFADYVVLNVSSPNTPGLRDLQQAERLGAILRSVREATGASARLLVKLAPDNDASFLDDTVSAALESGADGLVVSNTTVSRPPGLRGRHATEAGGLSGTPLRPLALATLRRVRGLAAGRLTLIGCGGVRSGADALERIRAGADLVQVYTEFAYAGPALVARLGRELAEALRAQGFGSVAEAVGRDG